MCYLCNFRTVTWWMFSGSKTWIWDSLWICPMRPQRIQQRPPLRRLLSRRRPHHHRERLQQKRRQSIAMVHLMILRMIFKNGTPCWKSRVMRFEYDFNSLSLPPVNIQSMDMSEERWNLKISPAAFVNLSIDWRIVQEVFETVPDWIQVVILCIYSCSTSIEAQKTSRRSQACRIWAMTCLNSGVLMLRQVNILDLIKCNMEYRKP